MTFQEADVPQFDIFADPNDGRSCDLLVSMNPYSRIYSICAYSSKELLWKFLDALADAKADRALAPCSCGNHKELHGG